VAGDRGQDHLPPDAPTYEDHEALVRALARGEIGGAVVDLLRARQWFLAGHLRDAEMAPVEDGLAFRFAVAPGEAETHAALEHFLHGISATGELARSLEEHLP
jgi:hypothetical protein